MNISEAKREVMELAGGRLHSIGYEVKDDGKGGIVQRCTVFIDGGNYICEDHWELALMRLKDSFVKRPLVSEDLPLSDSIKQVKGYKGLSNQFIDHSPAVITGI